VNLSVLLSRYGYAAVLIGCLIEGETIVLMGGFSAHHGYLNVFGVVVCAFVGSLAGDQLAYFLGKTYGERVLARRPKWRPAVNRMSRRLEEHGTFLLLTFRFLYGLRNAVPFAAGLSGIPMRRFLPLNIVGAAVWAPVFVTLGYAFGQAVEAFLDRARKYEELCFAALAVLGALVFAVRRLRETKHARV
jgi:membrane protein DedA with SNARE-associated domain